MSWHPGVGALVARSTLLELFRAGTIIERIDGSGLLDAPLLRRHALIGHAPAARATIATQLLYGLTVVRNARVKSDHGINNPCRQMTKCAQSDAPTVTGTCPASCCKAAAWAGSAPG